MARKPTKKKATTKKKKTLTNKEYAFIQEYLKDYNGARAARACGYNKNNPQNARGTATEILSKPHIKAFIKQHREDLRKSTVIEEMDILNLCKEIMSANLTDYYDDQAYDSIKLSKDSPNPRAIASLKVTTKLTDAGDEIRNEEIRLRDPIQAAEKAAKILGLYDEKESVDKDISITFNHVAKDGKEMPQIVFKTNGGKE